MDRKSPPSLTELGGLFVLWPWARTMPEYALPAGAFGPHMVSGFLWCSEAPAPVKAKLGARCKDHASREPEGLPTGTGSLDQLGTAKGSPAGGGGALGSGGRWQRAAPILGGVLQRTKGALDSSH